MARKKVEKPRRELTRRQLASWEKQKKRNRIVFIAGLTLIVAVLVVVGVGWFINEYRPLHQTVLRVNAAEFNMDYYIKMLKFYGRGQPSNLPSLAALVAQSIEQNQLIIDGAAKLGVTATDAEINAKLKTFNPPLSRDYRNVVKAQILSEKVRDEYFDKQVPAAGEQRQAMAMFLETEKQASDVRARLLAGEDFGTLAAQLSLDTRSREAKGDLGMHPKDLMGKVWGEKVLEERVFIADAGTVSPPIRDDVKTKMFGYWLLNIVKKEAGVEEVQTRGILLGSLEEAQKVRTRLETGEDFAVVSKEVNQSSTLKESGGDLGTLTPGAMKQFDGFLFGPEVKEGALSQPIRDETVETTGGYWLVKVVAIEQDKQIEDADRKSLVQAATQEWMTLLLADPENAVENLLTQEQMNWAVLRVTKELARKR